jgi:hypothetical protein
MNKEELIIGFFEKGYCCDLDEVKNTCLGLLEENQELKNRYYDMINSGNKLLILNCKLENQQKEFIEYLESYLKLFDNKDTYEEGYYDCIEEILSKFKEIIGDKDE